MSRGTVFRPLSALEQLELNREYPRLVPMLARRGLGLEDAAAVAFNACLLHRTLEHDPPFGEPVDVLRTLSLDQIAGLCEEYAERQKAGEQQEGEP